MGGRRVYLLVPSRFLSRFMSLLFLALSHLKQSAISQLQLQPRVLEGLPYRQDLVIDGVYRMGETALIVVSSRMTGTSLTLKRLSFKHLSPAHEGKHLQPFERSGGGIRCLGRPAFVHGRGFSVSHFLPCVGRAAPL